MIISCPCRVLTRVRLSVTLWAVAGQASRSMGFSWQEYWSGLLCPPVGDLPDPGIELASLMSSALAGWFFTAGATWEAPATVCSPGFPASDPDLQVCSPRGRQRAPVNTYVSSRRFSAQSPPPAPL